MVGYLLIINDNCENNKFKTQLPKMTKYLVIISLSNIDQISKIKLKNYGSILILKLQWKKVPILY